jgi:hypothetical protein
MRFAQVLAMLPQQILREYFFEINPTTGKRKFPFNPIYNLKGAYCFYRK